MSGGVGFSVDSEAVTVPFRGAFSAMWCVQRNAARSMLNRYRSERRKKKTEEETEEKENL